MDQMASAPYNTPANVPNNRKAMRPLPLRVASAQYARLVRVRDRTGISIQEHVRRAVDEYLARTEREAMELGHLVPAKKPAAPKAGTPVRPKVTKR